ATYVAPTRLDRYSRGGLPAGVGVLRAGRGRRRSGRRPATLLVLLATSAGAGVVAVRGGFATDRFARGQGVDAVVVQVCEHVGQAGDDLEPLAVADRGGRRGRVLGQHLAAGKAVEQAEDVVDPLVVVQPLVPFDLAQLDRGEEPQRPVAADIELVVGFFLRILRQPQQRGEVVGQVVVAVADAGRGHVVVALQQRLDLGALGSIVPARRLAPHRRLPGRHRNFITGAHGQRRQV